VALALMGATFTEKGAAPEGTAGPTGGEPMGGEGRVVDEEEGLARIVLPRAIGPGNVRLRIRYSAPFDETLEGLYRVDVGADHYAFTQFEAISARERRRELRAFGDALGHLVDRVREHTDPAGAADRCRLGRMAGGDPIGPPDEVLERPPELGREGPPRAGWPRARGWDLARRPRRERAPGP